MAMRRQKFIRHHGKLTTERDSGTVAFIVKNSAVLQSTDVFYWTPAGTRMRLHMMER